jgi:hypothetical protein
MIMKKNNKIVIKNPKKILLKKEIKKNPPKHIFKIFILLKNRK